MSRLDFSDVKVERYDPSQGPCDIDKELSEIRESMIRIAFNGRIVAKHDLYSLEGEHEENLNEQQRRLKSTTALSFKVGGAILQGAAALYGSKPIAEGIAASVTGGGQYLDLYQQSGLVPLQARGQAILSYLQLHQQGEQTATQQLTQAKAGLDQDEKSRHEAVAGIIR